MNNIIQNHINELSELRDACINENREPTPAEIRRADKLINEIDELKPLKDWADRRSVEPPDKPNPQDGLGDSPGWSESESRTFRNLKSPGQRKEYRDLFGGSTKEWRDEKMTFFEVVFSGRAHPDLTKRSMNESTPSDGGFLVPTEYSERIHAVSLENELVMPRAFVQPMLSNEQKLPGLDIGDHSSNLYGGFTASYSAEAGTLTEANPKARQMTLTARKLTGFLRLSNELVQDMPNGESQLLNICGRGLSWYRDKAFLKGTGAGEPLGILNADCTVSVGAETGQAAASIVFENITKMMSRLFSGSFQNSVWICHQSTIPQLLQLSITIGTGGSHVPALKESNGQFSMLTRPVIFTEKTEPLGTQGDIILADLSQYIVGLRKGMSFDTSQHVYFTTDELAARLIERHDGQPLWDEALTLEDGSTTVSPFVTLAERS